MPNLLMFLIYCLSIFTLSIIQRAYGMTLLYDQEINDFIQEISEPLFRAAKLENVKIHLVLSQDVNAYAIYDEIFLNSGLILEMKNPYSLAAVIAHEIAHVKEKHIVSKELEYERTVIISGIPLAFGLLATLAGGGSDMPGAMMMSAGEYQRRAFLQHSRAQEKSADRLAVSYLKQSNYDVSAMLDMLEILSKKTHGIKVNPYLQTHPVGYEREQALEASITNKDRKIFSHDIDEMSDKKNLEKNIEYRYKRVLAKLYAFTIPNVNLNTAMINASSANDTISLYRQAIIYYRLNKYEKAIEIVDKLLKINKFDPFFHELKGDIYSHMRQFNWAKAAYIQALEYYPHSYFIEASLLRLELNTSEYDREYFKKNRRNMLKYVENLDKNIRRDEYINLTFKASFYANDGDNARSYYYLAKRENLYGDINLMIKYAKIAQKNSPNAQVKKQLDDMLRD